MSEIKIRNCPFCGGSSRVKIDRYYLGYRVQCDTCAACTALYDTENGAIRAWNTRWKKSTEGDK